jgi:quercetin dioxygenase-like cupin family protein
LESSHIYRTAPVIQKASTTRPMYAKNAQSFLPSNINKMQIPLLHFSLYQSKMTLITMSPKVIVSAALSQHTAINANLVANLDRSHSIKAPKTLVPAEHEWNIHETAELFCLLTGSFEYQFEGQADVMLGPGEIILMAKGISHRSFYKDAEVMVIEKSKDGG